MYRVRFDRSGALGDAGRVGQCSPSRLMLTIDRDQEGTQLADTLLHEITHALLEALDLDDDAAERICRVLGPGWLGVIRDNPGLIDWVRSL